MLFKTPEDVLAAIQLAENGQGVSVDGNYGTIKACQNATRLGTCCEVYANGGFHRYYINYELHGGSNYGFRIRCSEFHLTGFESTIKKHLMRCREVGIAIH